MPTHRSHCPESKEALSPVKHANYEGVHAVPKPGQSEPADAIVQVTPVAEGLREMDEYCIAFPSP